MSTYVKKCRCTAPLDANGECIFKCPPVVKRRTQRAKPEPQRERGFNWRRDTKGIRAGSWKEQRDAHIAARANRQP